jgi:hypothetical protein
VAKDCVANALSSPGKNNWGKTNRRISINIKIKIDCSTSNCQKHMFWIFFRLLFHLIRLVLNSSLKIDFFYEFNKHLVIFWYFTKNKIKHAYRLYQLSRFWYFFLWWMIIWIRKNVKQTIQSISFNRKFWKTTAWEIKNSHDTRATLVSFWKEQYSNIKTSTWTKTLIFLKLIILSQYNGTPTKLV